MEAMEVQQLKTKLKQFGGGCVSDARAATNGFEAVTSRQNVGWAWKDWNRGSTIAENWTRQGVTEVQMKKNRQEVMSSRSNGIKRFQTPNSEDSSNWRLSSGMKKMGMDQCIVERMPSLEGAQSHCDCCQQRDNTPTYR
jgi:hypothetical protein